MPQTRQNILSTSIRKWRTAPTLMRSTSQNRWQNTPPPLLWWNSGWISADIHACYSRVSGGFFFPFPQSDEPFILGSYSTTDNIEIRNDGDETGFIIQIEAVTDVTVPEIAAVTPTIYNADTGEYLQIKGEILRGDIITISTKTGNKTVTLTRNGVDSNIINRLVAGSTWLTLREGLNTFHVQAVRNIKNLKITLMHTNAYLGV